MQLGHTWQTFHLRLRCSIYCISQAVSLTNVVAENRIRFGSIRCTQITNFWWRICCYRRYQFPTSHAETATHGHTLRQLYLHRRVWCKTNTNLGSATFTITWLCFFGVAVPNMTELSMCWRGKSDQPLINETLLANFYAPSLLTKFAAVKDAPLAILFMTLHMPTLDFSI